MWTRKENKRICNKSYDFRESFQTLFLNIYDFVCTCFKFLFFFFFEMWLSTLQTMAEEIVPETKKKEVKLRRELAKESRRRER